MKRVFTFLLLLLPALFMTAQNNSIRVRFTAQTQTGEYCPFVQVDVQDVTAQWNQTLYHPDTVLMLYYPDGVAENNLIGELTQNCPNPFYGNTEATLYMPESGQAVIRVINHTGAVLSEQSSYLTQGEYRIGVTFAETQLAFLCVTTESRTYVVKMLNLGDGGANRIDVNGVVRKDVSLTKSDNQGNFAPGDVMEYVAKTNWYGQIYTSNTVQHAQNSNEDICFVFTLPNMPVVETVSVEDITESSAKVNCSVTSNGGIALTARGVCWSTQHEPTIEDSHSLDTYSMVGNYTITLSNLQDYTTYYVRAYATNGLGTTYGEMKVFKTPVHTPQGALTEVFSVSATDRVYFSQGNLQYKASNHTWRFAENQWDAIGEANTNISSTYSGWIDLFGWATSGYNHGAVAYQPYSTSDNNSDYYAYDGYTYNLNDQTGKADWGYNAISNGGNEENIWRTLSKDEWRYIYNYRTTESGIRYAKATVNNVKGVIVLPDNWSASYYTLNSVNSADAAFTSNTISASSWTTLQSHGAVFMPVTGYRFYSSYYGTLFVDDINYAVYHTSNGNDFSPLYISNGSFEIISVSYQRKHGLAVRLVWSAPSQESAPSVVLAGFSEVTSSTAKCTAVAVDNGTAITAKGVCWSTTHNPTTSSSHTNEGAEQGYFTSYMTGLSANTTYYVRAYATNAVGTAYSEEMSFTNSKPTVTTGAVSDVTSTTVVCGGTVTDNGNGLPVTDRGVCWSTSQNPTITSQTSSGIGTGSFTCNISGLTPNTTYYIRAYATNSIGTSYGAQKTFKTCKQAPTGAINGVFSVSATKKVYFSKGNLQYRPGTWRFAEHQWDYVGENNSYIVSPTNPYWIDLFGWGTGNNPTNASTYNTDYTTFTDWGNNPISNGGNQANLWCTLTNDEWRYLINTRATTSGIRYAKATVNGVAGLIILPDNWSTSYYTLNSTNTPGAAFTTNTITSANWTSKFEAHGAVFLPAAGQRSLNSVNSVGIAGSYWSSSLSGTYYAYHLSFGSGISMSSMGRFFGRSVRLVAAAD